MVKRITAGEVFIALRRKGLTQWDLSNAAGIYPPDLSAYLRGHKKIGPERVARISAAIVELGLDDVPLPSNEPVFELPVPVEAE